ncbi:MAG: GTPase, partial [Synechocystis sp.]|nr:GTPase [Synechocystis sp.]
MPLPRLITIVLGLSVILGMVIWLIDAILRLYAQVSWTSPFLANILILLVIGLLGLLIYAFFHYFNLSRQSSPTPTQKRRRIKLPAQKTATAAANLQAVRRQVQQIQDQVAQQALLEKSRLIEAQLQRGNLNLVVFGTGSAGKTSLVNALLGEIQGETGPTMGTTIAGEKYYLYLSGVSRDLEITDTPGILEAGVAGTE